MNPKSSLKTIAIFSAILAASCTDQSSDKRDIFSRSSVVEILNKVNNKWQKENKVSEQWAFWHPSAYHIGNMEAYKLTKNENYLNYSLQWAENNSWQGAKSTNAEEWKFTYGETDEYVLFGDWQACFQVYIDLNKLNPSPRKIARVLEVMDYQVHSDENEYWWWIDGLFMVMPVMPRMYELTSDPLYLKKLYEYYS